MTIATSADQRVVSDSIAAWAQAREVRSAVRDDLDRSGESWRGLWTQIADLGLFAAGVPEGAGGADGTAEDVAVMFSACGAELVPGPLAPTMAAAYVLATEGQALADEVMAGIRPVVVPATAVAESAGFDVRSGAVDLGLVPAFVADALIAVPLGFDGGPVGWRVVDAASVSVTAEAVDGPLDGTAIPARVSISGLSESTTVPLRDGELFVALLHAGVVAYQAGVAAHVLDVAVDYAKVRTQFGAPIGSFQAIKQICADMLCRSEQLGAAAWDLARALDDLRAEESGAGRAQVELSRLAGAVLTADLAPENAKDAIQVLGGIGFTFEHDAHLYLRSALAARMQLAAGEPQRAALAELGRSGGRREFSLDLLEAESRRPEIAATADAIAAAAPEQQRAELARTGFLAPHWPEPYGLAADPAVQLLIDAELDRVGVVRPDLVIAGWALPTILEHGTDLQREKFVAPTLAGDIRWCQLFSEPEAGSDLASLRTRAVRTDGGWLLTGQKIWTSEAHMSQWAVCLARTNPDVPKHKGITYFLVDMAAAGIDIRPLRELTGRAMFNEVFLDNVFVPDEMVVGDVDNGWRLARTTLANERVAMGGSGLGKEVDALLHQLDAAAAELSQAQTLQLGRIIADAHIGRVLDARSVAQRLSGTDPGATSSVRKLIGVVHRQSVPEFATDLLGCDGLGASSATGLLLLNRCLSIAGGTTQILKNAAAERILGLPRG
ncbi:acyl-CoA dehydrogenase [Gordonia neofelifaecis]|uniref:Acyl-CoA dehydrogenase domain-containing protein n=1 Tax=Gordonia neofelifaecis NRRL B-59395 TaxID=644548 RepID=F1YN51_9ACTN|nr:acyl-CoA dehydrogenase [Gordonia neofelifaecis]EGD53938.1 acyl-CoA dehydrogenase domain-containing protein [Gordonia neofelifaecis NRRL B-59395]